MIKALKTAAIAATLAAASSGAAMAATFDFGLLATGNEGTWDSRPTNGSIAGGAFDGVLNTFTVDGISVSASASNSAGTAISHAYLDSLSGGKPAGLGVCSTVNAKFQCGTPSDDNIGRTGDKGGVLESVTLSFNKTVAITDLILRDRDHDILSSGMIGINGLDFTIGSTLLSMFSPSKTFTFSRLEGGPDFYLNTAVAAEVPVPLALPMAMAAFGGLALLGRRKTVKA